MNLWRYFCDFHIQHTHIHYNHIITNQDSRFEYYDQPTTGRVGDGENYSVGFVDIADTPVYEAVEAARKIAEEMYATRLSGERKVKITEQKTITY